MIRQSSKKAYAFIEALIVISPAVFLAVCAATGLKNGFLLSAIVAALSLLPFYTRYEGSRPRPQEIVPVAVFAALAAAGRILCLPFPNIQPTTAIVIFAGIFLGRRSGFLVGSCAAIASNVFFGQGIWTAWQAVGWGLVGYLAGLLFERGCAGDTGEKWPSLPYVALIAATGFFLSILYGILLDTWYIIGFVGDWAQINVLRTYALGMTFNLLHGASTFIVLLLILRPWGRRMRRITEKYEM